MISSDRDLLLGAAIQLIKDIKKIAFIGDSRTLVDIEHMAGDFLEQIESTRSETDGKD